jgi:signal transduction histidine kinase
VLDATFPGTSEMAVRMRQLDWSTTALGPVDCWPQSLRTSVGTCLNCAFPIVLWWGPALTILYNDEYKQILGPEKHPAALGQPGAQVWAEIWDVIESMLMQVYTRGEATRSRDLLLHVDRGYSEEAYFSFSYSPIYDDDGRIGGIFCPVIETTEKVIGERRLRTLRDLAARCKGAESEEATFDAAASILAANSQDVPFAMLYAIDDRQSTAVLKATAGIMPGKIASPETVVLDKENPAIWSLGTVAHTGRIEVVADLPDRFPDLPTGAWKTPPSFAKVLPVLMPGQHHPRAILVAAISPMRALDDDYRTFFRLIAAQIASSLADAQALEEERRRAEALAELDRAKTAFFSNVSHEFRTPLTLMLGPLEDLLAGTGERLPKPLAETLTVAHRNCRRLLKLVNTLLDFSRIEAGRIEASYEATDLATYTADLASVFRSAIEKAGLTLIVNCEPLDEPVYVDRDMWEKIVLNLLSNALKFTFDGTITVALGSRGDHVELTVTDTGVGIPEADMPRMFQRFHRVKHTRARTHEGTGIGLALVQELTRLHGGTVAVTSEEGKGTQFVVSVRTGTAHLAPERIAVGRQLASTATGAQPFVDEALRWLPSGDESTTEEQPALGDVEQLPLVGTSNAARPRVLIADDNADMRDYLGRILGQSYEITAAADGQAALEQIRVNAPDLVLTDVMMPNLDGFGLLAAIRAHETYRSIPVILLSARAGEEARIEGLSVGADDYIVKPFSARELIARITSQLALSRLRRDTEQALAESERRLREADRRKDEFLALLAHELRNPLAPIRTGLELIRLAGDSPEAVRRVRAVMERQVAHMVRLIDDLLDIARITSGKIVLQRSPTPLSWLVQGAVDAQRAALEARHIELTLELPPRTCIVDVDPTRVTQVLSNILHNALKFTPPHGKVRITGEVTAGRGTAPGELAIRISDTGMGIPKEMLPRIFELFEQGEHAPEHGGLGIGLALARRLVSMHGGEIEAHSDGPGRGSEFVVKLPLLAESEAPISPAQRSEGRSTNCRAVIIDDNKDAADTMSLVIQELGGAARTANDAVSGLKLIREFRPDIVFLDISMPGVDGHEACRRIRSEISDRNVVVVAMTGWAQDQEKQRALEGGFDAYLVKPVDPAAFEELLAGTTTVAN